MSQHARNHPDEPPVFEAFPGVKIEKLDDMLRPRAAEITHTNLAEWVHRKIAESGIKTKVELIIASRDNGALCYIAATRDGSQLTESSETSAADALARLGAHIKTPSQLAATKREQAAKLIAEADAMEPIVPQLVIP